MVNIQSKEYNAGTWNVDCTVQLSDGTRSGVVTVTLPEDATDQELQDAIVALYTPMAV